MHSLELILRSTVTEGRPLFLLCPVCDVSTVNAPTNTFDGVILERILWSLWHSSDGF